MSGRTGKPVLGDRPAALRVWAEEVVDAPIERIKGVDDCLRELGGTGGRGSGLRTSKRGLGRSSVLLRRRVEGESSEVDEGNEADDPNPAPTASAIGETVAAGDVFAALSWIPERDSMVGTTMKGLRGGGGGGGNMSCGECGK